MTSPASTLTAREREILTLIASGMTRDEIAKRIHKSPKTVDYHRRKLLRRFGVINEFQLGLALG